jgi:8-oxo-dGTP diphosphatase
MSETKVNNQLTVVLGILERDGKFLIIRRVDPDESMWHEKWELPGGRIEPGESPLVALHREVFEETSLQVKKPELLGVHTHHWNLADSTEQTFLIVYRAQVSGEDVVLRDDENDAFQWVSLDEFFTIDNHLDANREMIAELYKPLVEGAEE